MKDKLSEHDQAAVLASAFAGMAHTLLPFQSFLTASIEKYRIQDLPSKIIDGQEVFPVDVNAAARDYAKTPVGLITAAALIVSAYALMHAQVGYDAKFKL